MIDIDIDIDKECIESSPFRGSGGTTSPFRGSGGFAGVSVSVIVPIYNVEGYLERCLVSLMEQSLQEIEYVFVNDCSTDGSMGVLERVLERYPHRRSQVRIINHNVNSGVAAARASGMRAMSGEYMAHCDADDWLDPDAYRRMYAAAKAVDADMVTCRYHEVTADGTAAVRGVAYNGSGIGCLNDAKYTYGLWDKLIRASIIKENDILPFAGINYNEDLNVIVRTLCYCQRVVGIDDALYCHLVQREGSICSSGYKDSLLLHSVPSMALLDKWLDAYGAEHPGSGVSSAMTRPLKFWMKSGLYASGEYALWRRLWRGSRHHIWRVSSMTAKEKALMYLRSLWP